MNTVKMGRYKDVDAVILENDLLTISITPGFGARTASITYKPQGRELLWQNQNTRHARPEYSDGYERGEFAGFDEMFPTISRCFYEDGSWAGTEMPDHGEVWTLPWQFDIDTAENAAVFTVYGRRFPYRLSKRVSLAEDDAGTVFRGKYTLENLSDEDFSCIWAAHPLFNTHPGMRFIVPPGMDRIINAVPGKTLGRYGSAFPFPGGTNETGTPSPDLSTVPEENTDGYQKYYFADPMTEGWCLLYSPEWKLNIGLSFPKERVPYLGMWLNEGGYAGQYNIAPEPATGAMDRPDFAKMWGMDWVLPGGETRTWHLDIIIGPGGQWQRVPETE